ncbi:MAG: hypothetical protein ACYTFW_16940 [Planctomycetota bacterium]
MSEQEVGAKWCVIGFAMVVFGAFTLVVDTKGLAPLLTIGMLGIGLILWMFGACIMNYYISGAAAEDAALLEEMSNES